LEKFHLNWFIAEHHQAFSFCLAAHFEADKTGNLWIHCSLQEDCLVTSQGAVRRTARNGWCCPWCWDLLHASCSLVGVFEFNSEARPLADSKFLRKSAKYGYIL